MTPPVRVVYDIAELAYAHLFPAAATGIQRVVREMARGLHASPDCDLAFCATSSVGQAFEMLEDSTDFAGVPLLDGAADRRRGSRALGSVIRRVNGRSEPGLIGKSVRRALMAAVRTIESRSPLTARSLAGRDLFHTPFARIPDAVREVPALRAFQTIYDLIPLRHPEFFSFSGEHEVARTVRALHRDDWVITISECTREDLLDVRPDLTPEQVVVTPLAADRVRFRPITDPTLGTAVRARYGIANGPYLLSLNTLEPRKNLDRLLRSFARLVEQERMPDLQLVLVGRRGLKSEPIFETLAALPASARRRVVQTGYVADADLAPLYSGATAFVYPSLYEGFGLPPLEAMQCGVPVIASNTSALPEVVGDAGLLVSPTDEEGLAAAMLLVCSDDARRARMRDASRARAELFSWERCTEQTLAAYRASLGR